MSVQELSAQMGISQKSVSGIGAWLEDSDRFLLIRYRP